MCTPVQMEAVIAMLAFCNPKASPETWPPREMLSEGFESIDHRLEQYVPLEPERFSLEDANSRLAQREGRMGGGAHDVSSGSSWPQRWRRTAV
jgi:hypothetical protein